MKKFLSLLLAVLALFTVAACGGKNTTTENGDTTSGDSTTSQVDIDKVNSAKDLITVPERVDNDFTLNTSAAGGVSISWTSNNSAIVVSGQNATVTRPNYEDGDVTVTLTATFTVGAYSDTKNYTVIVTKRESADNYNTTDIINIKNGGPSQSVSLRGVVGAITQAVGDSGLYISGFVLVDNTSAIYVYGPKVAQSVAVGDEIVINGTTEERYNVLQVASPELVTVVSNNNSVAITGGAARGITVSNVMATEDVKTYGGQLMIFEGVKITQDTYGNYKVNDATNSIGCYLAGTRTADMVSEFAWLAEYKNDNTYNVLFYVAGQSSSAKYRGYPIAIIANEDLPEMTNEQKIYAASLLVSAPSVAMATGSLDLPTLINGVSVSWASNNTEYISNAGEVVKLPTDSDVVVRLTATLSIAGVDSQELTFDVTVKSANTEYNKINDILATAADEDIVTVQGIVFALAKYGYYLYDGTGCIYVNNAKNTKFTIPAVGDIVTVPNAEYDDYYYSNLVQKADPVAATGSYTIPTAEEVTIAQIAAKPAKDHTYEAHLVTITGTVYKDKAGSYDGIYIKDADGKKIYLNYGTSKTDPTKTYADKLDTEVTITVVISQYHSSYGCWIATDLTY